MFGLLTHLQLHCISPCANHAYCFKVCTVVIHGRSCESSLESVRRVTFRKSVGLHFSVSSNFTPRSLHGNAQ